MKDPLSAADRRPNDEPYYIAKNCPECGEKLVLEDDPDDPEAWHDEFVCRNQACLERGALYFDHPPVGGERR